MKYETQMSNLDMSIPSGTIQIPKTSRFTLVALFTKQKRIACGGSGIIFFDRTPRSFYSPSLYKKVER